MAFELPASIAKLYALPNRTVERALGIAGLDPWLRARAAGDPSALAEAGALGYKTHPFEVVPFAWQGGEGLQYALLLHDAAGARGVCVSYAPVDDNGPCWLGDDATQAIANLMGVALRDAVDGYDDPDDRKEAERETAEAVREVSRAIRVAPAPASDVKKLTPGARSGRAASPTVPSASRWVATLCRMGVLAPRRAFDPKVRHTPDPRADPDAALGRALRLLTRGFPGSALAVARDVYVGYSAYHPGVDTAAAIVMREAYRALGRPFLVARADAYLAEHTKANVVVAPPG